VRLYLDASTIVYSIEGITPVRDAAIARIDEAEGSSGGIILTSRLSCLECRVKPLRDRNTELLSYYDRFFTRASLRVIEIGPAIIDCATELRARYGLKTPDAIHAATAIVEGADMLFTGDRDLLRCAELKVQVL